MADDQAERAALLARVERAQLLQRVKAVQAKQGGLQGQPGAIDAGVKGGPTPPPAEHWYDLSTKGVVDGAVNNLPLIAGGIGAGVVGAGTLGLGTLAGAAGGGLTGQALKSLINRLRGQSPETREQYYTGLAKGAQQGVEGEMLGASAAPAVASVGKKLYNSALSPIEQALAKYGKSGIGDVAYEAGITNPKNIRQKLQAVANDNMAAVTKRYQQSTAAGGELDMDAALAPAQAHVDKFRAEAGANEELQNTANKMQEHIDMLRRTKAKEAAPELRELPFTEQKTVLKYGGQNPEVAAYDAPTMGKVDRIGTPDPVETRMGQPVKGISGTRPVINDPVDQVTSLPVQGKYDVATEVAPKIATVLDESARTAGPTPIQGRVWKSTAQNKVGDAGYSELAKTPAWKQFDKQIAAGLQKETERTVGRSLGPEAEAEVGHLNANTGKIISKKSLAAQQGLEDLTSRRLNSLLNPFPSGTEGLVGAGTYGVTHDIPSAIGAMLLQKAAKGANASQMPVGYGMRKAAPYIQKFIEANPWAGQALAKEIQGD